MSNKILISILGKGQYKKDLEVYDYDLTTYQIEDKIKKESKLVSDILSSKIEFEKIYIIGTEQSLWSVADEYLDKYEKIIIPYGTNSDEFWKIFEELTKLDVENKEIYFDVTHGFRSIPIFISTLLNFFSKVKNAKIKGVYYGIFEAKVDNVTPVVNMLPFLEMNQFVDAFSIFKKYSDGRDISNIIKEKFNELPNNQKKEFGKLRELANVIEFYSKAIGFSALELLHQSLNKIERQINDINKIPNNLKAIEFLISDFQKDVSFFKNFKGWKRDLETAKLLYNRNRYSQSLTILRETLINYIIDELNLDRKDEKIREQKIGKLLKEDSVYIQKEGYTKYFSKDFIQLNEKIRELRNKSNHAFIKRNIGDKDIKNSVENLKEYIKQFSKISKENKIFKNKDLVLDILNQETIITHPKMFLLFSHQLTPKQKEDAINSLKIKEFVSLPSDLQDLWSNIPPDIEELDSYLKPIFEYLKENLKSGDYALVQGDFGATCQVANFVKELNAIAVYATTKRNAIEKIVDGKVVKTSTFEHIRFRRF